MTKKILASLTIFMVMFVSSNIYLGVRNAKAVTQLYLNASMNGTNGTTTPQDVTLGWTVAASYAATGTAIVVRVKQPSGALIGVHLSPCNTPTSVILGGGVTFSTTSSATGTATFTFASSTTNVTSASSSLCVKVPDLYSLYGRGNYAISFTGPGAGTGDAGVGLYYVGLTGSAAGNNVTVSAQVDPMLSMAFNGYVCNLGSLSPATVNSCTYNIYFTTNVAANGVTAKIYANNQINDGFGNNIGNANTSVQAGENEYGIAFSESSASTTLQGVFATGDDPIPNGLGSAAAFLVINNPVQNATVTVTHKASVSANVPVGNYGHIVYYITTTNF